MINWIEVYTSYLNGLNPLKLSEKFNIDAEEITSKIKAEKWAYKRKALQQKIIGNFEKRLESLANKAFEQLEDILNDETASSTSKLQAAKTIIDLTGLKKEKKEPQEATYEVYINRKSVKCR